MVGEQIKKLLKANEMTQTQLAQKMNISDSKMSKLLSGSLEPNLTDLKLMSKIFSVTIDEMVVGETNQNISLIEAAIKEGIKSFSTLIKTNPNWIDRKDDKGHNMLYYIRKYDAYDYLTYFYQQKNTHVPASIQIFYVKMVKTLIRKKLYDKYLEIYAHKHIWDFSALELSLSDQDKLNLNNNKSSEMIYEVINKTSEKSEIYSEVNKDRISKIELEKYVIYGYPKAVFRRFCDHLLMRQNVEPKYIIDLDRRGEYLKTYYANNPKILGERIKEIKDTNNLPNDIETLNEALFLAGDKEKINDLMVLQIDLFEDIDLDEVYKNNIEPSYMSILHNFSRKIMRIKNYLILSIKYNDLELFDKLISNPKLSLVINSARKEKIVIGEYGSHLVTSKFFDFEMPFIFQKKVLETFPESIDEITFDYEEIIKSENVSHYKYAIEHLSNLYFQLPFHADVDLEKKLNRPLTSLDFKKLIDTIHSVIIEFNISYLKTGKLDYDAIYKSLLNKSLKHTAFKYLLIKIWINVGNFQNLNVEEIDKLFEEGIPSVEKIESIKEAVINYIFFKFPTYIDNVFKGQKLYELLPKIKSINFFKLIISGFNPNLLGRYINENNLVFNDIEKVKILYKEITNELTNNDSSLLYRTLL